ncbi:hypothetical protein HKD37_16G045396 [Glycine soja]
MGTIPTDKGKARKLRTQATRYVMIVGKLYLQGFSSLLLKCLNKEQVDYVIREIHEGICGMHSRGRSMSTGVKHRNLIHRLAEELHPITSLWPFSIWGIDILGSFSKAMGQRKIMLVVVDYFTKWVEVEPLATITTQNVHIFIWKNIITHFVILFIIVTNNDQKLNEFMARLDIKNKVTFIENPQTNGQAETDTQCQGKMG